MDMDFGRLGPKPEEAALKEELSKIILWNDRDAPRSKQRSLGPSELGAECDRRLAYRIAGVTPVNHSMDPWPAIVGTSIHDWLEKAINRYQQHVENLGYLTELGVQPDPLVRGRSDLFKPNTVIDWKSAGADKMRKLRKGGAVQHGYRVQLMLYGLGHQRAGRRVDQVALVFLPRSGWLGDMFVHVESYDEKLAVDALARMYRIGHHLLDLDIETNPHRFEQVDATPGDDCTWCPFLLRGSPADMSASDKGCPGR